MIFWDHGGGSISGFGYDETNSRAGSMTIDKIGKALSDGGVKFDFVGFDACLMATLETALAVEPYADYMIASEETEPGVGWYYTNWLSRLTSDSSLPTVELGKQIIDDFVSVCGQHVPSSQTTLSIVDLAELIGTVPDKFKAFSENTTEMIKNDQYQVVSGARGRTKEFGKQQKIDQIDLIHLTEQLGTPEAESLSNALRNAVKYNRTSSNVSHANGISIYFPYGRTNSVRRMTNMYEEIGLDDSYAKCIQSFASVETSGQAATGGQSGQLDSLFGSLRLPMAVPMLPLPYYPGLKWHSFWHRCFPEACLIMMLCTAMLQMAILRMTMPWKIMLRKILLWAMIFWMQKRCRHANSI